MIGLTLALLLWQGGTAIQPISPEVVRSSAVEFNVGWNWETSQSCAVPIFRAAVFEYGNDDTIHKHKYALRQDVTRKDSHHQIEIEADGAFVFWQEGYKTWVAGVACQPYYGIWIDDLGPNAVDGIRSEKASASPSSGHTFWCKKADGTFQRCDTMILAPQITVVRAVASGSSRCEPCPEGQSCITSCSAQAIYSCSDKKATLLHSEDYSEHWCLKIEEK